MRTSGILMPISCLPSPYGIGSLGKEAYNFVDFLRDSGQYYWQILPISPTGYGDSPYQSFSAFAYNPYFIDLDMLIEEELLTEDEVCQIDWGKDSSSIDYLQLYRKRNTVLEKAVARMNPAEDEYIKFMEDNTEWLEDYALFMSIKTENGMRAFYDWPVELRDRHTDALLSEGKRLDKQVHFWCAVQFLFFKQWQKLKKYANDNGVYIIGDIPMYVSPDSSDIWADSKLFQIGPNKNLTEVAGCPPDAFSLTGQLWGNPLYDWPYHQRTGYSWWVKRLKYSSEIYDVVRIDHFRGFSEYYAISALDKTAERGTWRKGPGIDFIRTIKENLPDIAIIAEDLGFITEDTKKLLEESGFPGMKVLQFAFDSRETSDYLPHNYIRNSVVYTGTHDNTTTEDWQYSAPAGDVEFAREYIGTHRHNEFTYGLIRAALSSVCDTAIIPMQDWLRLGKEARINTPSTLGGNWLWRMQADAITDQLCARIRRFTEIYGRIVKRM